MKANASKSLLLATFLIIGQAIAVHNMIVVDVVEYFEYAISQSPTRGYKRSVQPPELVEYWMKQFADSSARVSGPCGMKEDRAGVCDAPPYPYFSLSDERRNELLLRPPPDVLRANIERATNGELATVGELVERVNANIGNLAAVSDNELTLLATNFREPEAGLVAKFRCGPRKYGVWPEDLLVSQDEQRALVAAFIYVQNDDGYFARRNATLQKLVQEHNAKFMQQCKADTARGTGRFKAKVEQLDLEVILSEAEWLARYEEYVAVLRADLYERVPPEKWDSMKPQVDELIYLSENIADEDICFRGRGKVPAFTRFFRDEKKKIEREYPDLREGIVERFAFRRWNMLPSEKQAAYF